jgi:phage-related minor tail protein
MLKFDPENTELLAQKQKLLAGQVDNTKEKLEKLKEAERQVQEQFARGEVSEAQVRALRREIIKTEGQLKSYEEQVQEAADGTKKLADNANASSDGFTVMKGAMANLVSTGISAMVSGLSSLVSSLTELTEATREYRTEMGKLTSAYETVGHRTEIAEEAYKRLYGVIGETDQTVEAAQQIALLADSEEDVVQWSDLAACVVARFGDALQPEAFFEAANETIKLGEATGAYVQLIEGAGGNVDEFNAGLAACTTEAEKQLILALVNATGEFIGERMKQGQMVP